MTDSPITDEVKERLAWLAKSRRYDSHAPYSEYHVGAAVVGASGAFYSASNIEVKPTTNTLHAEQRAVAKALEAGERDILACAVATSGDDEYPPCGNCRNALATVNGEMDVFVVAENGLKHYALEELLPEAYTG